MVTVWAFLVSYVTQQLAVIWIKNWDPFPFGCCSPFWYLGGEPASLRAALHWAVEPDPHDDQDPSLEMVLRKMNLCSKHWQDRQVSIRMPKLKSSVLVSFL